MDEDIYVEVALPIAQYKTFTYKIEKELFEKLEDKTLTGRRVLVPFRKTGFTGIVVRKTDRPSFNVRSVEEIPDREPVFTELQINLLEKLSKYYVSPIGLTAHFFLPDVLLWKKKNGKWIKGVKEEKIYVPNIVSISGIERLSVKSLELLEFILERGEVTRQEIKEVGFSLSSLNTLIKKGLVKEEKYIFREYSLRENKKPYIQVKFLKKGLYLYEYVKQERRLKSYLSIIYSFIKKGEDVLVVFPTVKSCDFFYSKLKSFFGDKVFLFHDRVSGKEKLKTWFSVRKLSGVVLVGTFSCLLLPMKNLKLIIVEDEHSESYKPLRVPRFDTRRVAYELARKKKSSLIFSSTIPSVEAFYSVEKGIMKNLTEKKLIIKKNIALEIHPLNREKVITKKLIDEINNFDTVLVISNKKAYASFLFCKKCEEEVVCPECDIPLRVYSKPEKYLKCELCGIKYEYVKTCPTCDTNLVEIGFGIEKVEEILKKAFKDNVSYLEEERKTKIKLSTGIVDREVLCPDFDLVVNVYPDFLLNINDFRGSEKFLRNIFLGYIKARKKYILITNNVESEAVKSLKSGEIKMFYKAELLKRKEFQLPPFSKLILLTFEKKELSLSKVDEIFKEWLKTYKLENINYKGPFYAYYTKLREKVRIQVLIKDMSEKEKENLKFLYEKCHRKGIKLIIDVDPKEIL